jgi:hypothetical protein
MYTRLYNKKKKMFHLLRTILSIILASFGTLTTIHLWPAHQVFAVCIGVITLFLVIKLIKGWIKGIMWLALLIVLSAFYFVVIK